MKPWENVAGCEAAGVRASLPSSASCLMKGASVPRCSALRSPPAEGPVLGSVVAFHGCRRSRMQAPGETLVRSTWRGGCGGLTCVGTPQPVSPSVLGLACRRLILLPSRGCMQLQARRAPLPHPRTQLRGSDARGCVCTCCIHTANKHSITHLQCALRPNPSPLARQGAEGGRRVQGR